MGSTPHHTETFDGFMLLVPEFVLSTNLIQKQLGFVQDPSLNGLMLHSVHWIPVAVHIVFKTLLLAQKGINSPPPVYEGTYHTFLTTRDLSTSSLACSICQDTRKTFMETCLRHGSQVVHERPLDVRTAE